MFTSGEKGGRLTPTWQFSCPKQSPVRHAAPYPFTPRWVLGPLPSLLNEQFVRPHIRPAQSSLTNTILLEPGVSSNPPVPGPSPAWVAMPGHIDSPQSFATVSWIGVRLLGGLAVPLVVVFVFIGMLIVPLVVEFVGVMAVLLSVMFQGLIVTLPVVILNGEMVESVAVIFHGLMVRFPTVLLNGGMMGFAVVMVPGVLLLGVQATAAACVLKSDSDRTAPLASLSTGF